MYDFEHMDARLLAYVNLFICANRLQTIMDNGMDELTAKQWLALTMIDAFPEPPMLGEVADRAGVTHQNMRQLIHKLEVQGYVQVISDKKDKRAIRLLKTEAARKLRERDLERNWGFVFDLFSCLEEEETKVFCQALEKLCLRLAEEKKRRKTT